MNGKRISVARCPCTPPLTLETFSEEISAKACSGKEIVGEEEEYDDTEIVKSRRSGISRKTGGRYERTKLMYS